MESGCLHDLRSRNVQEDCIKYYLFIIDDTVTYCEQREILQEVCREAKHLTDSLLRDYVWQREGFSVNLAEVAGWNALCGETHFGDSIEDEWVVTFLLRQLSLTFHSLWIRLEDTDGEFLLIEAANALPRWVKPDVAENRVWINQGRLLLIPPECLERPSPVLGGLSLQAALEQLATRQLMLIHLPNLESEAFRRLQKYPDELSKNNHRALIFVPRKLAYILRHRPAYVCLAADALYLRDPISLKALHPPQDTGLTFGPTDLVEVLVNFTRVSFAKLKTQHFPVTPDWTRQLPDNGTTEDVDRLELGMKVACGFEMLIHDEQSLVENAVSDILNLVHTMDDSTDGLMSGQEMESGQSTEDSDSWLNIDYNHFEYDLDNGPPDNSSNRKVPDPDRARKELRKFVARFKSFGEEDDGVESDSSFSSDSDDLASVGQSDITNEVERTALEETTNEIQFNEASFMKMMRGWSLNSSNACQETLSDVAVTQGPSLAGDLRTDSHHDDEELGTLSEAMESELLQLGALQRLGPKDPKTLPLYTATEAGQFRRKLAQESREGEWDTDLNLAANILESFKHQDGLPGPGGNLMGLFGVQFPRDNGDSSGTEFPADKGKRR